MRTQQPRVAVHRLLTISVLLCACQGRRTPPAAAILPGLGNLFGADEKEEDKRALPPPRGPNQQPYLQQQRPPPKRPPPPPPRKDQPQQKTTEESVNPQEGEDSDDVAVESKETQQKPPPPPPRPDQQQQVEEEQMWDPYNPYAQQQPPGAWGTPQPDAMWGTPQQQYNDWQQQQQPYYEQGDYGTMQHQLEEFIAREHDLMGQIQNLTTSLQTFEQREDLHMRQLDVLTERVMDAEAAAAEERNELQEKRANCTELGRTIAVMQDELQEWKTRCSSLQEQHELDEERVKDIQATLKERDYEVEELAASIETARLSTERENYFAERRKRKKRGFFAWLFGLGRDDSDDDEEKLQELAKSTLLRALQRERNNVDELEVALSTLQQNNSAISGMVESRDTLINELNDRVAVFEEDKVVLKAALRQLQKEMREEAPKTQKLIHDLQQANEEINNLNEEIQSILSTHQEEVVLLQHAIIEKQTAINETESNLTVIGSYVDKLEERLATFAITRRDIELREQKCKEIEERAVQAELERDAMRKQADDFAAEHEELKKLLDELVQERTALRDEKDSLIAERDKLIDGERSLREAVASLGDDVVELDSAAQEWKARVIQLELELGEEATRADNTEKDCEELQAEIEALKASMKMSPEKKADEPKLPKDGEDEAVSTGESGSIWLPQSKQPPGKQKTGPKDRSDVPLRSLRKFFSEKTGMHGVFTASSRQLVPPPPRVPQTASGMPLKVPPPPPELPSKTDS